jgi:hypothetical protein
MALPTTGNHKVICGQGCEFAYNVWKFMSEEVLNGKTIPLKQVCSRGMPSTA